MSNFLKQTNFNGSNGSHFYLEESYDILARNIDNNTTTVRLYVIIGSSGGWSAYGAGAPVYINGVNIGNITSIPVNSRNQIGYRDIVVNHNDVGEGILNYSASVSTPWSGVGGASISGSLTLPTIPRASSVTATDAYVESATSINISRASDSFKHKLTYSFEGLTGTIAENIATNCGWEIPTSFYDKLTTKSNAECTVTCQTFNGTKQIGTKTTKFKVSVDPEKNKPDITATVIDTNTTTVNLTGSNAKLVKFFSNAKVAMTAAAKNKATIKSKKITCGDGKSLTDSGTINKVESGDFTISATDSRGISNSISKKLTLVDYIKLSLNASFYRSQPTNNEVVLTYKGNFFNKTFGSITNALTLKYRYREHGATTWSTYTNLSPTKSGNTFSNGSAVKSLGTSFDYQKEYDFELVASDKLMTVTYATTVPVGKPVFDWGKSDFQFNVPVKQASGNVVLDYTVVDTW